MTKAYKFDLEVKVQGRIRIMNVPDTSSRGDRPICQIWYDNVKANRSYRVGHEDMTKAYKLDPRVDWDHECMRNIVLW